MIESSMGWKAKMQRALLWPELLVFLGYATRLILEGGMPLGVQRPLNARWYGPILEELERDFGVGFKEKVIEYKGY